MPERRGIPDQEGIGGRISCTCPALAIFAPFCCMRVGRLSHLVNGGHCTVGAMAGSGWRSRYKGMVVEVVVGEGGGRHLVRVEILSPPTHPMAEGATLGFHAPANSSAVSIGRQAAPDNR